MDTYQVSPIGALLVIAFSLMYLVLFLMTQFKLFGRRGKKSKQFCEQAEQDGRMVTAHREITAMIVAVIFIAMRIIKKKTFN